MYGLYLARELHPDGMVYFSQDTHYSVSKILRLLRMPHIMIRSLPSGEMDYEDLHETLRIHRDVPPIIFANIGTTMREGVDDVERIQWILKDLAIPASYIHADAALCGMTLPFIEGAPRFDFSTGIQSLSISGHKFIGCPIPSGVIIAKRSNRDRIAHGISYIGSSDTTITGSRNGHSPLFLWYALKKMGLDGMRDRYKHGLEVAEYCEASLKKLGVPVWRNPGALTVVLPKVPKVLRDKWQLATEGEISHIICMPNVSKSQIDAFIEEFKQCGSDLEEEFDFDF